MKKQKGAGVHTGLTKQESFKAESVGPQYSKTTERPKAESGGKKGDYK